MKKGKLGGLFICILFLTSCQPVNKDTTDVSSLPSLPEEKLEEKPEEKEIPNVSYQDAFISLLNMAKNQEGEFSNTKKLTTGDLVDVDKDGEQEIVFYNKFVDEEDSPSILLFKYDGKEKFVNVFSQFYDNKIPTEEPIYEQDTYSHIVCFQDKQTN